MDRISWLVAGATIATVVQVAVIRHLPCVRLTVEVVGRPEIERPPLPVPTPVGTIEEVLTEKKPVRFNGGQLLAGDDHLLARYDAANDELVWEPETYTTTYPGVAPGSESWKRLQRGESIYGPTGSELPDGGVDQFRRMEESPIGPGAVDCELYQLRPGQWGWVGNGFLVPTSHGIVPDSGAHVWDHPADDQSKVLKDANGVLNVYLERRLERRPYQEPPLFQMLGVRVHWLDQ